MHHNLLAKHNFMKHHSIPILLLMSCVVALLLNVLPTFRHKAYAAGDACTAGSEQDYVYVNNCVWRPSVLTEPPAVSPSLSLSIDGGNMIVEDRVLAEYNRVNYSAHTVNMTASDISAYTLILSDVKVNGPMALTGASNVKGSTLTNNSWGYGWDSTSVSNDNIIYSSAASKNLADVSIANNSLNLSKKLVFAAKFDERATAGTYKVSATISAVATPMEALSYVPWENLVYLQDMSSEACEKAPTGVEKKLIDVRDKSADATYTVQKLSDGKCWMTQNLRLTRDNLKVSYGSLSEYDTDVTQRYDGLPNSSVNGFSSYDIANAYYSGNVAYGAYYSWYAATAGTGTKNLSGGEATSSVCPKNWRLPTETEYTAIAAKNNAWGTKTVNGARYSGKFIDGDIETGIFWPAAGYVSNGTVYNSGSTSSPRGRYWSSTSSQHLSNYAFYLYFSETSLFVPSSNSSDYKYEGYFVRCVAR